MISPSFASPRCGHFLKEPARSPGKQLLARDRSIVAREASGGVTTDRRNLSRDRGMRRERVRLMSSWLYLVGFVLSWSTQRKPFSRSSSPRRERHARACVRPRGNRAVRTGIKRGCTELDSIPRRSTEFARNRAVLPGDFRWSARPSPPKHPIRAAVARAGHDVVMAPQKRTYFDHCQTLKTADEPLTIGSFNPLEQVYRFDPIPADFKPDVAARVLGSQGHVWTEYIPTPADVERMAFPRVRVGGGALVAARRRELHRFYATAEVAHATTGGAGRAVSQVVGCHRERQINTASPPVPSPRGRGSRTRLGQSRCDKASNPPPMARAMD